MKTLLTAAVSLPDPLVRLLLLTAAFFGLLTHPVTATIYLDPVGPSPLLEDRPNNSTFDNTDRDLRMNQMLDYLRHQGPAVVQDLPDGLREPTNYVVRQLRATDSATALDADEDNGTISSFLAPVFALMHPADEAIPESLWLQPGYQHAHGILPFDDAVMLGFNYRNVAFDNRLKFNIHPFYAQSWDSSEGYWGTEIALGIGPEKGVTWGKIVLRYDNGSSDLMGHASGYDVHADFAFNRNLGFTAGVQENEEGDLGNYALFRWRWVLGK